EGYCDLIRLAGAGSSRCSGRVEIFHNNIWGTITDFNWDLNDAEVVCRQLNCGSALQAPQSAYFGPGTGPIWLGSVTCSGNESSLTEFCVMSFSSKGPIRLTGSGSTRCSGRVEVYHNNSWGTVCDDGWDLNDAEVVCRQLNCGSALEVPQSAHFGAGTGQIWLDHVTCSGNESSLTECQHSGFGSNTCEHGQDAAVICSAVSIILTGSGSTQCSGRVEVYLNNSWGTVCNDGWDLNDAEVVCRQLNCGSALEVPQSAHFGAGTGQIWLDNVSCSGNESSLTECQHSGFGSNTCEHVNSVLLYLIRLVGSGSSRCSGRVEIFHNNIWGTVSDSNWNLNDAEVVCRQLNFPPSAHFGAGTGQIWLDHVTCSGNESSLAECQHSGFGSNTCEHGQDAAVICSGEKTVRWRCYCKLECMKLFLLKKGQVKIIVCVMSFSSKGPIRLTGSGSTRCSGRVEVYHNNSWGTICDDGWDLNDAEVVCRQLNCGSALEVPPSAHFGAGTGQIWLDHVTCSGNESSLTECQHSGFGSNTCEHGQDAAVICSGEIFS
uniref:SRCR domain-containing protein n=1 Tax=Oreochromis aureus TaxID=47969 RepID=A0AAZ1Y2X7_OREAU